MLTMLHYDALNHSAENQIHNKANKRAQLPASWVKIITNALQMFFRHVAFLERSHYEEIEAEDLEEANEVILEEALYGN